MLGNHMAADWPRKQIAEQIRSRQKSRKKLPEWFSNDDLIFPVPLSVEQSSSELLARHKAKITKGELMVDLSGGFGVDAAYMSVSFEQVIYVEQNEQLCELARHNFTVLGLNHIEVVHADALTYLQNFSDKADLIYVDPSRRAKNGERVQALSEGKPDLNELLPLMRQRSHEILIKASPMVDVKESLRLLEDFKEVQILERDDEVREILFRYPGTDSSSLEVFLYKISSLVSQHRFEPDREKTMPTEEADIRTYLYDPSGGIRKSGMFRQVSESFDLPKVGRNTHLYTSDIILEHFPGRVFEVLEIMKPKAVKKRFKIANIITRNYPQKPEKIKKAYRIKDGGEDYLIFLRDRQESHLCLHCRRIK